jgi:hypothetical protein
VSKPDKLVLGKYPISRDSWPLTPAKDEPGDQQWSEIKRYRIEASEIERLSRWRCASVVAPSTTVTRDLGLAIHLKHKIYSEDDAGKKYGVTELRLESDVLTAVLLMRFRRMPTSQE